MKEGDDGMGEKAKVDSGQVVRGAHCHNKALGPPSAFSHDPGHCFAAVDKAQNAVASPDWV